MVPVAEERTEERTEERGGERGGEDGATRPIRAAGCVLWRCDADDGLEIALVHRPHHDDWSHPKGKLDTGESFPEAAVREVAEETGMSCALGPELPTAHYRVRGRAKVVRYWAAEATGGVFEPNHEVDELLWLPADKARTRLTHDTDRTLLDTALAVLTGA